MRGALRSREGGFALLIAIVVLVVLSLMFGTVVSATRQYTAETASRLAFLRLHAATEGALVSTVAALYGPETDRSGTRNVSVGAIEVKIRIRPEASKLDLNSASPEVLTQLLVTSGVGKERSQQIARELLNNDYKRSLALGVAGDQQARGGLRHKPIEALADLGLVQNGGQDLIACLIPDVTLFTHSPDVDVTTASERLRSALSALALLDDQEELTSFAGGIVGGFAARPDLYEITEAAQDPTSGISITRQLVVRLTGDPKRPYWLLSDRSPAPTQQVAEAACRRLDQSMTGK
jgi:general secretion pathway protein K